MSLQGSLSQLGLADVLQNAIAGREGALVLTRGADRAVLHLTGGALYLLEPQVLDAEDVLSSFVHRGLLPREVAEKARQSAGSGTRAVEHLIQEGQLDEVELHRILASAAEDGILDLLSWTGGEFRFEEGAELPPDAGLLARTSVDTGGVLLRAAQRLDERNAIADRLGLNAHLFAAVPGTEAPPHLEEECGHVHAALDGQRTLDEVALMLGIGRFASLRAVFQCVMEGVARPATAEELAAQVDLRSRSGQYAVCRMLLLQWAGLDPVDPTPLTRLARLSKEHGRLEEHADAMLSLGHLLLHRSEPHEALAIFSDLLSRRQGDPRALSGQRLAAEAAGDQRLLASSTFALARSALDENQPERAAQLLTYLVARPDATLEARTLNARALVRLKDREGLLAEAEAAARLLGARCRRKGEHEAAAFFRDAIAGMAPERTDLLRTFRLLTERGAAGRRRVALVVALLAVFASAGVLLWPKTASSLLADAQQALESGDTPHALQLIAELIDRHPESPEAEAAFQLQNRLSRPTAGPSTPVVTQADRDRAESALSGAIEAVPNLPAPGAVASLDALAALMAPEAFATVRRQALLRLQPVLDAALRRLDREARMRADGLLRAHNLAGGYRVETEDLRSFVATLKAWQDDELGAALGRLVTAVESLYRVLGAGRDVDALDALRRGAHALDQAWASYAEDVRACRRMLIGRDLEVEYDVCRTEAPKLLVAGRLDDVEACYATLEARLVQLERDPVLAPLDENVKKRRIPEFLAERRTTLQEIRRGLEAARAAEAAGDLAAATEAYTALASKFWFVRFENVFTVPLRIRTIPAGAGVSVNGTEAGLSPLVVRYAWGGSATLTIRRPGYEQMTEVLGTRQEEPRPELVLPLMPQALWTARVDATVTAPPSLVEQDVLVCDRTGRVTRHAREDGRVIWARQLKSLEGIRARAIEVGGVVLVPFVDGRLLFLDARDGRPLGERRVGRPVGEPALLKDLVAIVTREQRLVAVRGQRPALDVELPAALSAGLLAAHDALWFGSVDGRVVRVDHEGAVRVHELAGDGGPVVGLQAAPDGLLVTTGKGNLYALDVSGAIRWKASAVGDVLGAPGLSGDTVATVDRRGRILFFALASGEPRGQFDLRGEPRGGLVSIGGLMAISREDGHLWIYDAAQREVLADVDMRTEALFPATPLGDDLLAVPGPGRTMRVIPLAPLVAR